MGCLGEIVGVGRLEMSLTTSPTIRRQRLGAELRALRKADGLTLEQVCDRLGWASTSKLSRIELGQSRPDLADIMDLLDVFGVAGGDREKLIVIARDAAGARGWWRALGDMGARQRGYAELEASAAKICEYHQLLVPGLLQTPEYARVRVMSGRQLHGDIDFDTDARARAARQAVLHREAPPQYEAIIEEVAFRRAAVPPKVLKEQVQHLISVSDLPNVTIRVLPLSANVHDFFVPHTGFSLYSFHDPADPATVAVETLTSDVHLRDDEDVAPYRMIYSWLCQAALSVEESGAFLASLVVDP